MLKYLRVYKISLPMPSDRPGSDNYSDRQGLVRWLPLVTLALTAAFVGGCKKSENREFEPNLVYIKQQEEIIGQPLVEQQHEDIDARLKKLFGTSMEPTLPKHPDVQAMFPTPVSNVDADLFRNICGCVRCHGYAGTGAGTEAKEHEPYPRDYRRGIFKYKATKKGARPTDDDLRRIITNGVSGAGMPSFKDLGSEKIDGLIRYVKYLSLRGEVERRLIEDSSELDTRVGDRLGDSDEYLLEQITAPVARRWHTPNKEITPVPEYPKESGKDLADSARRGRHLFYTEMAGCAKCHGDPPLDDELANDYDDWTKELNPGKLSKEKLAEYIALGALPPRILQPRVLRDGAIRGGEEPEDIFRRIVNGIDGTPMPAAITEAQGTTDSPGLSDRDIWDLVNYVRDLPNQPVGPPEKKP